MIILYSGSLLTVPELGHDAEYINPRTLAAAKLPEIKVVQDEMVMTWR